MPDEIKPTTNAKVAASSPSPKAAKSHLPSQKEFLERLREQAQQGLRTLLESLMQEELTALLGASWGEVSEQRRGYRNGSYTRDLGTREGMLFDLKVPRDREGRFQTQVFERYARYEPQVEAGLREMFVAGVSTEKVGAVAEKLIGVTPSKSAVSRINADLITQYHQWQHRELAAHWRVFYLDGVYYEIRHGEAADRMVVLAVIGVDPSGNKELLGLRLSAEENKEGWLALLGDLRQRGVTQLDLAVTDGNTSLIHALKEAFPSTPRQRCVVHKQRNVTSAIPRRERGKIAAELAAIWQQPDKANARMVLDAFKLRYKQRYPQAVASLAEGEAESLTFYDFPVELWPYIKTTNTIEGAFSQVRARTDQIDVFTTEESCLALVWATFSGITFQRIPL